MARKTQFERDFEDLHGARPRWRGVQPEVIRHEEVRRGRVVAPVDHVGARLVIGVLGLFWGGVLLAITLAGVAFLLMCVAP